MNAARIRLWLDLKGGVASDVVERRMVTYLDLRTTAFIAVNPLVEKRVLTENLDKRRGTVQV